jgi:TetR/AcrR family transcriptional repressor of nem operon
MSDGTAEKILEATHKLLVDRGFSAFSYADVAEAVQIRKASIHYHFRPKPIL